MLHVRVVAVGVAPVAARAERGAREHAQRHTKGQCDVAGRGICQVEDCKLDAELRLANDVGGHEVQVAPPALGSNIAGPKQQLACGLLRGGNLE
eukprot:14506056-Alexandrium_andersonii.AAC.1